MSNFVVMPQAIGLFFYGSFPTLDPVSPAST
jgi:hypothetical protein